MMETKNKNPLGCGGSGEGAQDEQLHANDSIYRAFAQRSRFASTLIAADRQAFGPLIPSIESRDALNVLKAARGVGAAYVVLAGQLHRAKAGCLGIIVKEADVGMLETACVMAFDRLTGLGETDSMAIIAISDRELRGRLERLLSGLSSVEGAA